MVIGVGILGIIGSDQSTLEHVQTTFLYCIIDTTIPISLDHILGGKITVGTVARNAKERAAVSEADGRAYIRQLEREQLESTKTFMDMIYQRAKDKTYITTNFKHACHAEGMILALSVILRHLDG